MAPLEPIDNALRRASIWVDGLSRFMALDIYVDLREEKGYSPDEGIREEDKPILLARYRVWLLQNGVTAEGIRALDRSEITFDEAKIDRTYMNVMQLPDDPRLSPKATARRQGKAFRGTASKGRFTARSVTKPHQHHLLTVKTPQFDKSTMPQFDEAKVGLDPKPMDEGLIPAHIKDDVYFNVATMVEHAEVDQPTLVRWVAYWRKEARKAERALSADPRNLQHADDYDYAMSAVKSLLALMYAKGYNVTYELDPDNVFLAPLVKLQRQAEKAIDNGDIGQFNQYLDELDRRAQEDPVFMNVVSTTLGTLNDEWRSWADDIRWGYVHQTDVLGNAAPTLNRIGLSPGESGMHATAIHELGHMLDYRLGSLLLEERLGQIRLITREALSEVPLDVLNHYHTRLGRAMRDWKEIANFKRFTIKHLEPAIGKKDAEYLMRWREIWARAMEMYAAQTLGGQWKRDLDNKRARYGEVGFEAIYWNPEGDEWKDLFEAIQEVLDAAGIELTAVQVGEFSIPVLRIRRRS